jgi:raffinose/stachyose/melibiose transport system permease protein
MAPVRARRRSGYLIFLIPGVVLTIAVVVIPLAMTIAVSFTRWQGVGMPAWIGVDNYVRLVHDPSFWASFRHIGVLIVAMAIVPTLVGLLIATVLFDYVAVVFGPRTASVFRSGFYLPQVLPVAIAGIVWSWILHPSYGALNSLLQSAGVPSLARNWLGDPSYALASVMVVLVWVQIGYPVVVFMAGHQRIDPDVLEAAQVDGASWRQRFTAITVHLLKPEIYVVLVTTTIAALKIFGQIYVLTRGGPGDATLVPSYFAYKSFFEKANVGYGSAISTVLAAIILGLTLVFLRLQAREQAHG